MRDQYEIDFEERDVPTLAEAEKMWNDMHIKILKQAAQDGLAFEGYLKMAKSLKKMDIKGDVLIALALNGFFKWHHEKNKSEINQRERIAMKKQQHRQHHNKRKNPRNNSRKRTRR